MRPLASLRGVGSEFQQRAAKRHPTRLKGWAICRGRRASLVHMFDRQKGAARRRMDLRVRLSFPDGLGVASCGIWHKLHDPTQQRQACPAEEDGISISKAESAAIFSATSSSPAAHNCRWNRPERYRLRNAARPAARPPQPGKPRYSSFHKFPAPCEYYIGISKASKNWAYPPQIRFMPHVLTRR